MPNATTTKKRLPCAPVGHVIEETLTGKQVRVSPNQEFGAFTLIPKPCLRQIINITFTPIAKCKSICQSISEGKLTGYE